MDLGVCKHSGYSRRHSNMNKVFSDPTLIFPSSQQLLDSRGSHHMHLEACIDMDHTAAMMSWTMECTGSQETSTLRSAVLLIRRRLSLLTCKVRRLNQLTMEALHCSKNALPLTSQPSKPLKITSALENFDQLSSYGSTKWCHILLASVKILVYS